jgi:hypothetical protein
MKPSTKALTFGCALAALTLTRTEAVESTTLPASEAPADARGSDKADALVATEAVSSEITSFLRQEINFHAAAVHDLKTPQPDILGVPTSGDFSWGSFMRAVMEYAALSGDRTVAGHDIPAYLGQVGLIDAKHNGHTWAQLGGAVTLTYFGRDLSTNPLWQSLSKDDRTWWRSLLDPGRFYDRKTRTVIDLPENYCGVASLIIALDYRMGIVTDRTYVDDILDRASEQFFKGALYSDDFLPTGRYDRYSQEYARNLYEAAELVGRKDIMKAVEPGLTTVMKTWWALVGADGRGYPWGRTITDMSYMDTMEIVAFLAQHPSFRPAPLPELASVYYAAWQWLKHDYSPGRHLLNIFAFGRGNYPYMTKEREWQQTVAFFSKVAGAQKQFEDALRKENVVSFPAHPRLPDVTQFDFFRHGGRPAGAWLVRLGLLHFALPFTTGPESGVADYLPAPHGLPGFAAPVQQMVPALVPHVELTDGRVIYAGDGADEIVPAANGKSLRATWQRWATVAATAGTLVTPGLKSEVTWTLEGTDTLVRSETITASHPLTIRHFSVILPSTADRVETRIENGRRTDRFISPQGILEASVSESNFPLKPSLQATGDAPLGCGAFQPIPLLLSLQADDLILPAGGTLSWTLRCRVVAN